MSLDLILRMGTAERDSQAGCDEAPSLLGPGRSKRRRIRGGVQRRVAGRHTPTLSPGVPSGSSPPFQTGVVAELRAFAVPTGVI